MDKSKVWEIVGRLEKRERENAARYIELNPTDAERRKHTETMIISAYHEIARTLTS